MKKIQFINAKFEFNKGKKMKKLIFIAVAIFPMLLQAGQYIGVHGGTDYGVKTNESNAGQKVGFKLGGVYGFDLSEKGVRAEVEASYRESHKRTRYADRTEDVLESRTFNSRHSWSYMVNLHYDINSLSMFGLVPYVGAGLGIDQNVEHNKIKQEDQTSSEKRRDTCFAYQGLAGLRYPLSDTLKVDVKYAYHIGAAHQKNHSCTMGLHQSF